MRDEIPADSTMLSTTRIWLIRLASTFAQYSPPTIITTTLNLRNIIEYHCHYQRQQNRKHSDPEVPFWCQPSVTRSLELCIPSASFPSKPSISNCTVAIFLTSRLWPTTYFPINMRFSNVDFFVLDIFPSPIFPTKIAAYSSSIHDHVQGTDTLRISASPNSNCPSIVGRVCQIVTSRSQITPGENVHESAESDGLFLRMNWYLENNNETREDEYLARVQWHSVPIETRRACLNVCEVAQTNLIIWVSPQQIQDVTPILHEQDCRLQTYGPVAGRVDTFWLPN